MEVHEKIFEYLRSLDIPFQNYSHPPAFTCEQSREVTGCIPGRFGEVKNRYYLLCALYDTKVDLKALARFLDAPELRFARPDELEVVLGVAPGSVTPLALINDKARCVSVVLDEALLNPERIGVHPLRNDMTTLISPTDLIIFLKSMGYAHRVALGAGLL